MHQGAIDSLATHEKVSPTTSSVASAALRRGALAPGAPGAGRRRAALRLDRARVPVPAAGSGAPRAVARLAARCSHGRDPLPAGKAKLTPRSFRSARVVLPF